MKPKRTLSVTKYFHLGRIALLLMCIIPSLNGAQAEANTGSSQSGDMNQATDI